MFSGHRERNPDTEFPVEVFARLKHTAVIFRQRLVEFPPTSGDYPKHPVRNLNVTQVRGRRYTFGVCLAVHHSADCQVVVRANRRAPGRIGTRTHIRHH
jgi:hypothetical protein